MFDNLGKFIRTFDKKTENTEFQNLDDKSLNIINRGNNNNYYFSFDESMKVNYC